MMFSSIKIYFSDLSGINSIRMKRSYLFWCARRGSQVQKMYYHLMIKTNFKIYLLYALNKMKSDVLDILIDGYIYLPLVCNLKIKFKMLHV